MGILACVGRQPFRPQADAPYTLHRGTIAAGIDTGLRIVVVSVVGAGEEREKRSVAGPAGRGESGVILRPAGVQ